MTQFDNGIVLPESGSVKKKPGELRLAPAVPLARSNVVVTPQKAPADQPSRVSVTPSPASPADTAIGSPESSERSSPDVSHFEPTRGCPACESGVEAPGIRHTKACKKRFADFEEQRRKERRVEPELSPKSPVVVPQVPVPVQEVDDEEVVPTPENSRKHRLSAPEGLRERLRPTENSWNERSVKILKNCFKQTWILTGFGLVVVNLCWLRVWVH